MRLYLVRHGNAVDSHIDSSRPLSAAGRAEAARLAKFLRRNAAGASEVWHSGKVRARETAEIINRDGGLGGEVLEQRGLSPEDHPSDSIAAIEAYDTDLCVVGHLPHVSLLASALLSGQSVSPFVLFDTATAVCLERNGHSRWHLCWMISPAQLSD